MPRSAAGGAAICNHRLPVDYHLFRTINDFTARHAGFEKAVEAYSAISEILFVALLVLLFFVIGRQGRTWATRAAVAAGLSATAALAIAQLVANTVDRARPYAEHHAHLFVSRSADPSFPSDHATAAFAIAVSIRLRNAPWGNAALTLATTLAFARVAVGTHYPGDVIGGALLGTLVAFAFAITPLRRLVDRAADLLARTWESVIGHVIGRPTVR
jgi:undecaprenyl-diphosphatase